AAHVMCMLHHACRDSSHPCCRLLDYSPLTLEIYPLSLHDALPILLWPVPESRPTRPLRHRTKPKPGSKCAARTSSWPAMATRSRDRKSTRLNSSHGSSSYAVFCLQKKH